MCAPPTSTASWARPTIPNGKPWPSTTAGKVGAAQRLHRFPLGRGRPRRRRQVEPGGQGGAPRQQRRQAQAVGDGRASSRAPRRRRWASPISAASSASTSRTTPAKRRNNVLVRTVPVQRICAGQGRRRARSPGGHRVRPAGGQLRRGPRPAGRAGGQGLQRRHALHPGLAGAHHRHAARAAHHRGAPVCRQRRQDPWQVDGDHRRGHEPLVPRRHELPRRHQHADDVRLHRPERRRLGALRGPGKAAAANRLDGAGLCAGLDAPAAADELHQLLLRPHRPVALRKAGHGRGALAAGRQEALRRQHDRLQRARRAHGLAAVGARNSRPTRCRWCAMRRPPAWSPRTMPSRG